MYAAARALDAPLSKHSDGPAGRSIGLLSTARNSSSRHPHELPSFALSCIPQESHEDTIVYILAGALVAPLSVQMDGPAGYGQPGLGPLRIWPGGLCVSRSIGDMDVGDSVIASPHIRQVLVPPWGCRVIACSDGVWDSLSTRSTVSAVHGRACGPACNAVIQKCLRVKQGALVDDTTCCVIDCRPHNVASFKRYFPERSVLPGGATVRCFPFSLSASYLSVLVCACDAVVPNRPHLKQGRS
jgi:hypothetical protein